MPSQALDSRALQLQISASAELMIRQLKVADRAVSEFRRDTESNLSRIDSRFASLGRPLERLKATLGGGALAGGLIGALGGTALLAAGKRALEYASSLGEVSQQLGVTATDLQVYRYAASQVGIEQDTMDRSLAKLTVTMGKAGQGVAAPRKAFEQLGISLADLRGRNAGEVIPLIADGLAKIADPAKRAAIEVALFGKAGQQLDTLLAGGRGQIDSLARSAHNLGIVLSDKQIQDADRTADKLSELKQVLEARIAGVVADNATSVYNLANGIATLSGEIVRFLNANPEKAAGLMGALVGARVGGLPGAAAGGAAGYLLGERQGAKNDDANMDLAFRRRALAAAYREQASRIRATKSSSIISLRSGTGGGGTVESAAKEVARQQGLLSAAEKAGGGPSRAKATLSPPPASIERPAKASNARRATRAAEPDPLANIDRDVNAALRGIRADIDPAGDFRNMLDELDQVVGGARDRLDDETTKRFSRPLAQLRTGLRESVGDMDKALEGVAVNGLYSVENGLLSILDGTRSVKEAFGDMARSILADLARIAIERAIFGIVFPGAARAAAAAGSIGGLSGARANGGPVDAGGLYLVGERGPEIFAPGRSGSVIPNHALTAPRLGKLSGSGGGSAPITFDLRGAVMTADLLSEMQRISTMTGGQVLSASVEHTNRTLASTTRARL